MEGKVASCQEIIRYTLTNPANILTAVNMAGGGSVIFHRSWVKVAKNTRLAVYGDAVANAHLCRHWIQTELDKGSWTKIRLDVMGNENLARVGFREGLDRCLNLNPGTVSVSPAMMATAVEAILGAVHLDGGDAALATVMDNLGLTHDLLVMFKVLPHFMRFFRRESLHI